jgi:hypothetical protein
VPVYFFDSSALVKCYVIETGTAWVRTLVDTASGNELFGLNLTEVEVVSAITRRERTGSLPPGTAPALIQKVRTDLASEFISLEVTHAIVTSASTLCEKHGLRAYDAVQLAAALQFQQARNALGLPVPTVVSADQELNAAAVAEGLTVDDPNSHP